jgi:hypothetical protein
LENAAEKVGKIARQAINGGGTMPEFLPAAEHINRESINSVNMQ